MQPSASPENIASAFVKRLGAPPDWCIIAGSGLSSLADSLEDPFFAPYSDFPGLPGPTVAGHQGQIAVGRIGSSRVAIFRGRTHGYESGALDGPLMTMRAIGRWGCGKILLTNAAGGLNPAYAPGTMMLLADHINLMWMSVLRGPDALQWGPRFADLSDVYDSGLRQAARQTARLLKIPLEEGVYCAVMGPSFETPAEARMLRLMGGDAVGMSTAPEAIAARQIGMRVLGISCIANSLVRPAAEKTTHEEVLANSALAVEKVVRLVAGIIAGS